MVHVWWYLFPIAWFVHNIFLNTELLHNVTDSVILSIIKERI